MFIETKNINPWNRQFYDIAYLLMHQTNKKQFIIF